MPIDPKLVPYIDASAKAFPVPAHKLGAAEYRALAAARISQSPKARPSRIHTRDVLAGSRGHDVPVRIYASGRSSQAGLVFIHGGGFVLGSVAEADPLCLDMAAMVDCTVLSIEYRLAPEHPYPAALLDCETAVDWFVGNASSLQVDPKRLAVCGASAGGGLAAALCQKYRSRGGSPFLLQALLYPMLDTNTDRPSYMRNADGPLISRDLVTWFWRQYLQSPGSREDPLAVPNLARSVTGLPPAYVATAEYDVLRDEGAEYAARLVLAGINVRYRAGTGLVHGFARMRDSELAAHEFRLLCDTLREALQTR